MDYSAFEEVENSSPWASSPRLSKSLNEEVGSPDRLSPTPSIRSSVRFDREINESTDLSASDSPKGAPLNSSPQSHDPSHPSQDDRSQNRIYEALRSPRGDQAAQSPRKPNGKDSSDVLQYSQPVSGTSLPKYKLQAKVTGLERASNKDPIFQFDVYTNLPKFRTTQYRDIGRTHSEFVKFAEHLASAKPEVLVPAVPRPYSSAGVGTEEYELRVKASIQNWLNIVFSNEILMWDKEMVFFTESDFGYSPVTRKKQHASGVRRKVLKQYAPPPDDSIELREIRPVVKSFYLGTMDCAQKLERVVKARRALGLSQSDLGLEIAQLHVQETHRGLANAYKKLGKVIQITGDYQSALGTAEATTLADALQYHSSDAYAVKEALTNRQILLRELIQAQKAYRSAQAAADRLKNSSNVSRDKVDQAIAAVQEARVHEAQLSEKAKRVTTNLVQERRKWFTRTAADMRQAIREFVVSTIDAERRTLATLESVRVDIRAIDGTGGLSRLGREGHPTARRSILGSSQGPKGDAWSGVPRRLDGLNRKVHSLLAGRISSLQDYADSDLAEDSPLKHPVSAAGGMFDSMGDIYADEDETINSRNAASRLATLTI